MIIIIIITTKEHVRAVLKVPSILVSWCQLNIVVQIENVSCTTKLLQKAQNIKALKALKSFY